jgi:hypothetical protein
MRQRATHNRSIEMTMRYAHLTPDVGRDTVKLLDARESIRPHPDDVSRRRPTHCVATTRSPARPGPRHAPWPRGSTEVPCCKA